MYLKNLIKGINPIVLRPCISMLEIEINDTKKENNSMKRIIFSIEHGVRYGGFFGKGQRWASPGKQLLVLKHYEDIKGEKND